MSRQNHAIICLVEQVESMDMIGFVPVLLKQGTGGSSDCWRSPTVDDDTVSTLDLIRGNPVLVIA